MKRLIILGGFFCLASTLLAQEDTVVQSAVVDTIPRAVPAWFKDTLPEPKTPFYAKSVDYLKEEVLPELYEEEDRLKLKVKIPWREEDFVVPYFPKGLLPADAPPPYDPEVAWQRSAILPGLGQVYNGASWKVPIFWIGYGAAAWWISYNQSQYQRFGRAYLWAVDDDPNTVDTELAQRYDASGLRSTRNDFRQARDNGVLILLGWHALQIVEAYVDAHLNDFDVSPDLGLQWSPVISGNGLGFRLEF